MTDEERATVRTAYRPFMEALMGQKPSVSQEEWAAAVDRIFPPPQAATSESDVERENTLTVLGDLLSVVDEFHDFCKSADRPCGNRDRECPIGMGEWVDATDLKVVAAARSLVDKAGGRPMSPAEVQAGHARIIAATKAKLRADMEMERLKACEQALLLAQRVIEKHNFAGTDQNPMGVRDVIGSALLAKPAPTHEAPRDLSIPVRVRGIARDAGEPRSLSVALTERPTDDDIRSLHEFLRGWEP